jgi:TusA-related sulfurtransferase
MTDVKPHKTVDCIGLFCPEPIFRTRIAMDTLKPGEILEIWADDPASESDIQSWSKRTGHELLKIEKIDGKFRFLIRKVEK